MRLQHTTIRRFAAVLLLSVVAAACTGSTQDTTTTTTALSDTSTTTTEPTTTTTEAPPFVYRVGLAEQPTTANYWAYYDPQSSLVDQYILNPTKPSLYTYDLPGYDLAADVAADAEPPEPVEEGEGWSVTVDIDPEVRWSDGEPIDAGDVVFTFETVQELGLSRGWASAYPLGTAERLGLVGVEAVDEDTVVYRYNGRPGLPFWPNGPGTAPIMPEHFWTPILEEALQSSDPLTTFLTSDAAGEPSGGPFQIDSFASRQVVATPNANYQRTGERVSSGGATYEIGPFFDELRFTVYPDKVAAAEALDGGEIDIILSPSGVDDDIVDFLATGDGVDTISNPSNGFRYLGFNLRNEPMASPAFRDALAIMIDREFMADKVLEAAPVPRYTTVPPGNPRWYSAEIAEDFADRYRGASIEQRLASAVEVLEEAGFGWEARPAFIDNAVINGSGVTLDENPVEAIRILAPDAAADPVRSTYALWIEQWLNQLGFDTEVILTDFTSLVNRVFTPTPAETLDFDMYVLGWRLPNPAMPVYHESFFASYNDTLRNGGNNAPGFADQRLDTFVDEYNRVSDPDDAFDILWEMEQIVFDEKPYIVLYDAPIAEAFRSDTVLYPFTDILDGIQSANGMPALVRPQQ